MKIASIFTVVDYKTKEESRWEYPGYAQDAIRAARKDFPRFSKFVLEGFDIDGNYVPLIIR